MVKVKITNGSIFEKSAHQVLPIAVHKCPMSLILPRFIKFRTRICHQSVPQSFLLSINITHQYFTCHEPTENFLDFGSGLNLPYVFFFYAHPEYQVRVLLVRVDGVNVLHIFDGDCTLSLGFVIGEYYFTL